MRILNFLYEPHALFIQTIESDQDLGQLMEPDPLSFSFNTIGWKVLAILLVLVLIFVTYRRIKRYRKNAYRRDALKKIEILELENIAEDKKVLGLQVVLKQVAIIAYGREQVAALYGQNWLSFLDSKISENGFVDNSELFQDVMYADKPIDQSSQQKIFKLSKTWIHAHS